MSLKRQIDLEKAAEQEAFGALAIGKIGGKPQYAKLTKSGLTSAQAKMFAHFLHRLVKIVKGVGAQKEPIRVGDVSVRLQEKGATEILTIRGV